MLAIAETVIRAPSTRVGSGMLRQRWVVPGSFGRHGRNVHERHRQAPALGVAQCCVVGQVADVGARGVRDSARQPRGAPAVDDRTEDDRGEERRRALFGDGEVLRLRAVVVRIGKVEDVDRDALDRERLRPGQTPSISTRQGATSSIAARTAFGVFAAETGSTRPTTSSPATSSPSSAVATSPLGLISPLLYGWKPVTSALRVTPPPGAADVSVIAAGGIRASQNRRVNQHCRTSETWDDNLAGP